MIGLFQIHMGRVFPQSKPTLHPDVPHAVPIYHFNLGVDYLLSSVFVYYFAVFRGNSFKVNIACFIARLVVLLGYAPLLLYTGAYLDGAIIASILIVRLCYTAFYSIKFRSVYFLVLNSPTLAWIFGKCWYYNFEDYTCYRGGDSYIKFGPHFVPFINDNGVYLAVRGRFQKDVHLVRRIELINTDSLYIFASEPVVGITNIKAIYSSQQHEHVVETN
ncbi:ORF3 protein [Alphacoronavirus Bat-CoV/P.kuhlii/Italy/206679-3/2010]|nr:ORF3 protein [Alphacoronavirus Bat-CoV/P.kuhlii/Italy/206679-3/2010]